jgi:Zn-dependent protease
MRGAIRLFKIAGIDIKIHYSWWFIFLLLTWSLSTALFPAMVGNQSFLTYWTMGIVSSFLLFVSVLLHELSHSLVAIARKIKVETITLFFFGGVSGITKEDIKPMSEFLMAIAGPLFSLFLAGVFYFTTNSLNDVIWKGITLYLFQLNMILGLFNLVPGFPLDGGRVFRAILNGWLKDLRKATKIAATGGKIFAGVLIILGIFGLFNGFGNGLWFFLLGAFLYFIAGVSYEQVVISQVLTKVPVQEIFSKDFKKLPAKLNFSQFVRRYAHAHQDAFIVKSKNSYKILNLHMLDKLPRKAHKLITLDDISLPLSKVKTLNKSDNAYTAFKILNEQKSNVIPVIHKGKLIGICSKKAIVARLLWSLRFEKLAKS